MAAACERDPNSEELRPRFEQRLARSHELYARRRETLPAVSFPPELPIVERLEEVREAIERHQVIVLCGETGSGKSTQLPKICLALGRGVAGRIGHTQPRRIAARTLTRIFHPLLAFPGSQWMEDVVPRTGRGKAREGLFSRLQAHLPLTPLFVNVPGQHSPEVILAPVAQPRCRTGVDKGKRLREGTGGSSPNRVGSLA